MAFTIDQQLAYNLQHLDKYDKQNLDQLCLAAYECLKSGSSLELFQNEESKTIITQSMTLIVQALKFGLSENELNDLLSSIECNHYYQEQMVQLYQRYRPGLANVMLTYSTTTSSYNRYVQLQWKFEVKIASKYIREQLVPKVILRFHATSHQGKPVYFDMQCAVADIFHMVDKLGDALRRNNSQHCIKLLRQVK